LATVRQPIKPLAPAMFSTKIVCPSSWLSAPVNRRASVSVAPPGAKPTTSRIGRLG